MWLSLYLQLAHQSHYFIILSSSLQIDRKTGYYKIPRINVEKKLLDIDLGNDIFGCDTRSTKNKSKNQRKEKSSNLKAFAQQKKQKENATYRMGEEFCTSYIKQGVNSQKYTKNSYNTIQQQKKPFV